MDGFSGGGDAEERGDEVEGHGEDAGGVGAAAELVELLGARD